MLKSRVVASIFAVGIIVHGAGAVYLQDFPNKPVRIFANEPGGNSDLIARLVAPGLASALRQPVIIENRGGSIIAAQSVATAPPDGYALFLAGTSTWIGPLLEKRPYDPVTDFSPVITMQIAPNVLVVHPSLPVKSVRELIALAKARPGELNFASTGSGGNPHLALELFNSKAGVKVAHIPYKGGVAGTIAVLSGQVHVFFPAAAPVLTHWKSGRLRALAVTTAQPSTLFPGVPTMSASGLTGFESVVDMLGILAPAKTPVAVISRLNQEFVRVMNQADVKEKLDSGGERNIDRSPEALAAAIKLSRATLGKVIMDLDIGVK